MTNVQSATLPKCAYIASYSPEYSWQNAIERGLVHTLSTECQIHTFYMNSKQVHDTAALAQRGLDAKHFIEQINPDLLLFSDDNAVHQVLQPYYKDVTIPAVFCGVNESGLTYGLPYRNTTGMIEKSNFPNIIETVTTVKPNTHKIAFLTSFGPTEEKDASGLAATLDQMGLDKVIQMTHTELEWRDAFKKLNQDPTIDVIILGSYKAYPSWHAEDNLSFVETNQSKMLMAIYSWMLPYSSFGVIKSGEEQGQWAALSAIEILRGTRPDEIPVVPNQHFEYWVNQTTLKKFPFIHWSDEFQVYRSHLPNDYE